MFRFKVTSEHRAEERYELAKKQVVIGRSNAADLIIHNGTISRRHCRVDWHPTGMRLIDYQATWGVLRDGVRLEGTTQCGHIETFILAEFNVHIEMFSEEPEQETAQEELRLAREADTTASQLEALSKISPALRRVIAARSDAPTSLLKRLSASYDVKTLQTLVQNPNTPPDALVKLGVYFPEQLRINPAFPLLLLEDPSLNN